MPDFRPELAEHVHFATDDRIGLLAEARWRMTTGGTAVAWQQMSRDDRHPTRREARDWIRAAVAAGILPLTDEAQHWADHGCHQAACSKCAELAEARAQVEQAAAEAKYAAGITTSPLSQTPLAVAFGAAIPAPRDGEQADGGEAR